MRTLVRDLIPEPTPRFFSEAQLNRFINLGHRRFVEKTLIVEGQFTSDLFLNQSDYDLTGLPHLSIRKVAITDNQGNKYKLRQVNLGEMDDLLPSWENSQASQPAFFVMKHNRLMSIFPTPAFQVANGIEITAKKIPTDLVQDTDIPEYPRVYHDAPVEYAVGLAKQRDQEFGEADKYFARFEDIVARARRDLSGDESSGFRTQEIIAFVGGRKI